MLTLVFLALALLASCLPRRLEASARLNQRAKAQCEQWNDEERATAELPNVPRVLVQSELAHQKSFRAR